MPSTDSKPSSNRWRTRREFLASGTGFLGALTGCSLHAGVVDADDDTPTETQTPNRETRPANPSCPNDHSARTGPVTIATTGALSEAVQLGAGLWNANPSPTADRLVWTQMGARPRFDERLADHFTAGEEVAPSGGRSNPPFHVATTLSKRERAGKALVDGTVDVAGLGSTRAKPEPTEYLGDRADAVVRELVARDGWAFIVSPALAESGLGSLTPGEIRRLYTGDITNWRTLGGPDVEPFLFLGPGVTSSTNTAYENFFFAGNSTPSALDYRAGQASQLVSAAAEHDNALGVVQASGVRLARERDVRILDVTVDGDRVSVYEEGYPLTDDVYLYTLDEPDAREQAFLELLSSPFGQRVLVGRGLLPVEPPAEW
ncbi:PstS family phosphate ABC transporter substrate-binding protein [Halorubrum rubrum]|uniref:PstS family phosphate ABC transporter substrate-binding protein n=1 Tax=Halorubrum rubrum TaxID=1126240 RepID=A0ABD5QZA4_9EURY|nr:substrate-binding domain-containing protein [Halorubrum rubrum]